MPKTKEISQEKIFMFLWPDKCWHEPYKDNAFVCRKCNFSNPIYAVPVVDFIPDPSTPDGMVMILDRLVEMGYWYSLKKQRRATTIVFRIFSEKHLNQELVARNADTAPLAVLNAVQALMEKEEKE